MPRSLIFGPKRLQLKIVAPIDAEALSAVEPRMRRFRAASRASTPVGCADPQPGGARVWVTDWLAGPSTTFSAAG